MAKENPKNTMLNLLSDIVSIVVTQAFWFFCITMNLLFIHQLFN